MENATLKTLLIYDSLESGRIWSFMLEQIGLKVTMANITHNIFDIWQDCLPDVVLFENTNFDMREVDLTRKLRKRSAIPILLLTSRIDEAYLIEAYQAGVDECILEPITPRLFLAKIRAWLRQSRTLPYTVLDTVTAGGFTLDPSRRSLTLPGGSLCQLTNLEMRLMLILLNHIGQVIDTMTLIERIWGSSSSGDALMLKNLVYRLRRKIEINPSQPAHLLTVARRGYRLAS